MHQTAIEMLRAYRENGFRQSPTRAPTPQVTLSQTAMWRTNLPWFLLLLLKKQVLPIVAKWRGILLFLGTGLVVSVLGFVVLIWHHPLNNTLVYSIVNGLIAATGVTISYYLLPLLAIPFCLLWHQRRPSRASFRRYSPAQQWVSSTTLTAGLFYLLNHSVASMRFAWHYHYWPANAWHRIPAITNPWHQGIAIIASGVALYLVAPWGFPRLKSSTSPHATPQENPLQPLPFGLWLGQSTGLLANRWHRTGLAANCQIVLTQEDASQNILVLGGSGSGKTTRVIQPLLAQLLDQDCGGLIFDIKGDVNPAVQALAKLNQRKIVTIGPGHHAMNLLAGLSPEMAATFLESALLLNQTGDDSRFWTATAVELCRNTLGALSFLPDHYTLHSLYNYLFNPDGRASLQAALSDCLPTLSPDQQRILTTYQNYEPLIFEGFDKKVISGVKATIAQVLAPFNHPDLIDAFCRPADLSMQSVLDGTIYVVNLPLARWGLGAKVAYTLIKLRLFNVMQSRIHQPDWNQTRPVFFMCDEYQNVISASPHGLSDLNFWDKSRASKTIGIISGQSVNSFYAAIGNREITDAILQNFRQKICFKTEDHATLQLMARCAGHAKVKRKTIARSQGDSSKGWFRQSTIHHTYNESITDVYQPVLDAPLFRQLSQNQAVALLSLRQQSMDDVLRFFVLYVNS